MGIYRIFIFLPLLANHAKCDVFTSIASLEDLLSKEEDLIDILKNYVKVEQEKIVNLMRYVNFFDEEHGKAMRYGPNYVKNPINSFKLLRRMMEDWGEVEALIGNNSSQSSLEVINTVKNDTFPTEADLKGAAMALQRLKSIYKMNSSSIADGVLNGVQYDTELSAEDCFSLGHQIYKKRKYKGAIIWMMQTEKKLNGKENASIHLNDVLYIIFSSARNLEDIDLARDTINRWLEIYPDDEDAQMLEYRFRQEITEKLNPAFSKENYREVCRNKSLLPAEVKSKLKCRYVDNNNPYLRIGPFKLEEAFLDPDIFIFHDVIGDEEIAFVKNKSVDILTRSEVIINEELTVPDDQRISQSGFLSSEHKIVRDIRLRASNMTNLDIRGYETLQVANYGIGGYYQSHYDFLEKDQKSIFKEVGMGNRIATLLFYLSDVEQGGATVFPLLNAAVWPKKGSAVFWYNLFPSGDGDQRSLHSACPVLVGSKWVSTIWIHEHFQEFKKPCTLERPREQLTA